MKVAGLMSGTSADGVDVAVVEITGTGYRLAVDYRYGHTQAYPGDLRQQVLAIAAGAPLSLEQLATLDDRLAQFYAQLVQRAVRATPVDLIASHGQTVFHRPPTSAGLGYSLQLGRGDVIAQVTGLPVVSDFRTADLAAGGEGAPLVPPVDLCLFGHPHKTRCIQNIGGIGNVTYLPAQAEGESSGPPPGILGWDTGPGNSLIDIAVGELSQGQLTYDRNGDWAAQGTPAQDLIEAWMGHPYFQKPPPKSTGRELFGWDFLKRCRQEAVELEAADWLATLTDFTAASIAHSYRQFLPTMADQVLVCGGGSHNEYLMQRLRARLAPTPVDTIDTLGIVTDYKEAIAFAVLGYWRWHQFCGNLPSVTGASRPCLLGTLHRPTLTRPLSQENVYGSSAHSLGAGGQ